MRWTGAAGAAVLAGCKQKSQAPASSAEAPQPAPGAPAEAELVRFPEKTDLILLTERPPQLETPLSYLQTDLTPNDAFFVRWHLAGIPTSVDTRTFRLSVAGHVERPLDLSIDELRTQFEPVSVVAVNECSGNSRSHFEPRVPGGQWNNGAVGNAKWTGVRLSDLLKKAEVKSGAVDVSFRGLDEPVLPATPAFVKSLRYDHANDGEVIVAYAMNDQPMPMLNGFPLRLVVPGWYATYWVKALNKIDVLAEPFHGFWMDKAYRVPNTPDAQESPDRLATDTVPISRITVRSLVVKPEPGERIARNAKYEVQGIAFDSGRGIAKVEVSTDGGTTWSEARLDPEIGRFSFRRWRFDWQPAAAGAAQVIARATNAAGETQPAHQWNRGGYARNVMEPTRVIVA